MATHNKIMVGERHGKRVVVAQISDTVRYPKYLVHCDCGLEQIVTGSVFRVARSCRACSVRPNKRKYGVHRIVQKSKLYSIWIGMRFRCRTVDDRKSARYGFRGIRVCSAWDANFAVFERWALKHGYRDGLTIDRLDNDGNYEPTNCEWVTRAVNSKRMRALYQQVPRTEVSTPYASYFDFPIESLFEAR